MIRGKGWVVSAYTASAWGETQAGIGPGMAGARLVVPMNSWYVAPIKQEVGDMGLPGGPEIVVIMVISVATTLVVVLPFWFICRKAGFPGVLSLLMLVPVANIVLPFYLAFADWPALKTTPEGVPHG